MLRLVVRSASSRASESCLDSLVDLQEKGDFFSRAEQSSVKSCNAGSEPPELAIKVVLDYCLLRQVLK